MLLRVLQLACSALLSSVSHTACVHLPTQCITQDEPRPLHLHLPPTLWCSVTTLSNACYLCSSDDSCTM